MARQAMKLEAVPWLQKPWNHLRQCMRSGLLPHGLLLHGSAGCGKALLAAHLARTLLCESSSDGGCGSCSNCHLVDAGSTSDLVTLEPEEGKRDITVRQVRGLIHKISLSHQTGTSRVIIVAPAERMNRNAANALLKSLEEPAPGNLFLLVAEALDRLPVTILSRVQRISIDIPSKATGCHWLQQQDSLGEASEKACRRALVAANGAPLKALDMIKNGDMEHYEAVLADLRALMQGTRSPLDIASHWQQRDLEQLFGWVQRWLSQYIKNCSQHIDSKRSYMAFLLGLYEEASQCRRLSNTPVNTQLLAERWLFGASAAVSRVNM